MSKTILAKVDGFTPVIDTVMRDTSLMAAIVFGDIWRFCQMKNGVCQATLEKIAERVGLSRQAIIKHIKTLETTGYIEDMTPNLRNRPHTYRDTGKAGLYIGVSTVNYVYSENEPTVNVVDSAVNVVDSAVNVVDSAVNVVDSHSTPRVLEDSIKKESKTEGAAAVFTAYQDSIAMLDGHMRDVINDYLDNLHIPPQWIIEAINIAVEHNKRYWAYCAAILKRWAVEGRTDRPKQPEPSYYCRPAILDEDESKYVIPE